YDITGKLADVPMWKLVIDPRNDNLCVGTDDGVYLSTYGGGTWERFGAGLPYVQGKDMVLNQALDTLSIGSYGRSMFTFWLDEAEAGAGALTSISGNAVWTGPVIMAGDTVISAHGTQTLKNGISAATLEIGRTVRDQTV